MMEYLPAVYFIAGLIAGVGITVYGLRLGFKLSYEIRNHREKEGSSLFPDERPAELDLEDPDEGDVAEGVLQ